MENANKTLLFSYKRAKFILTVNLSSYAIRQINCEINAIDSEPLPKK